MQKSKSKKNILVVTGTRAEYGLLRSTMDAIAAHPNLALRLLVTGMHTLPAYGNTQKQIVADGYTVDATVRISPKADMLASLTAEINGIKKYCVEHRPDCIVLLGDRDEPFAAAIVALHLNIPIAHIHGGDVTGPGVDETIRHVLTKMAHIHFPGTKKSAQRIRAMGEEVWRIKEVGSVVLDAIDMQQLVPRKALAGQLQLDPTRAWLTVLQHPTAFDTTPLLAQIAATLQALDAFPEHEKIILYPNNDEGSPLFLKAIRKLKGPRVRSFASLPRGEYMSLLKESDALVGNSSSGIIEVSVLGTPTVDVGNRQRGRERARSVLQAGYDVAAIARAITRAIELKKKNKGKPFASPYGKGQAGVKIAAMLASMLEHKDLLSKRAPFVDKK